MNQYDEVREELDTVLGELSRLRMRMRRLIADAYNAGYEKARQDQAIAEESEKP